MVLKTLKIFYNGKYFELLKISLVFLTLLTIYV